MSLFGQRILRCRRAARHFRIISVNLRSTSGAVINLIDARTARKSECP